MCRREYKKPYYINLFLLFLCSYVPVVEAKEPPLYSGYFYQIDEQLYTSLFGYNSVNHMAAIGSTSLIVSQDIDWHYYQFFTANSKLQIITFPAVIIGGLGPLILPAYLHYNGAKTGNTHRVNAAYAVGQATLLSILITSSYKSVTGRLEPDMRSGSRTREQSKQFEFGFLNNGIFNGWPSGHATTAMAIATSYSEMYPDDVQSKYMWYLGALYISFGISTNIHWLSDAIAGSLIGYGIGKSVGRAFYLKSKKKKRANITFIPFVTADIAGVSISKRF